MGVVMTKNASGRKHIVVVSGFKTDADNETLDIYKCPGPGLVKHVTFDTDAALGANLGIDLVNGGTSGTGTTVLQASTDNLNGVEEKDGVDGAVQDGTVLRMTFDDYATPRDVAWAVTLELYY